jgi:hypothetical protein
MNVSRRAPFGLAGHARILAASMLISPAVTLSVVHDR